jgi:GT2 family glycosyltransferase
MSKAPDVSIIVVTHQGRERALQTLESMQASLGEVAVEWLLVDSGSSDGTPDAIEARFPDLQVTRVPNVGFAAGNNVALPKARGRYVLLLNPDIEVVAGTLEDLVKAMDTRPEVGVASTVQLWPDGRLQHTIRRSPSPVRQAGEAFFLHRLPGLGRLGEDVMDEAHYAREVSADWLVGSFLLVRADALADVGLFDERFFLFSEETDWCHRFRAAGWEIRHLPRARLVHHTGRMLRPDLYAQNSYSKVLYAQKHFRAAGRSTFRAALALRHAVRVAMLAPLALVRPDRRLRLRAERQALAVVAGLTPPQFRPVSAGRDLAKGSNGKDRLDGLRPPRHDLALPELEDEKRPDAGRLRVPTGRMAVEHVPDASFAEPTAAERTGVEQNVPRPD